MNNSEDQIVVLCCEYPKNGTEKFGEKLPEPAVYVVAKDPKASDLEALRLRSRFNPELQYYCHKVSKDVTDVQLIRYAKSTKFKDFIRL